MLHTPTPSARKEEIESTLDEGFISRSGARVLFRLHLDSELADHDELNFEKSSGEPVTGRRLNDDRLLALQPGKPPAGFRRVQPPRF